MRIDTDVSELDVVQAIRWIDGLVGPLLDKRVAALAQQARQNTLLGRHFEDVYRTEIGIFEAKRLLQTRGGLPRGPQFDLAYGFITAAQRIFEALPPKGKTNLLGRLRDMTRSPYGARPLSFEVGIATHMMQQGWEVDFVDLCSAERFDFLVSQAQTRVEIECKTTSGDTGRRIHRREVNRLGEMLRKSTSHLLDIAGCHLLRVTIPDRLGKKDHELETIVSAVTQALNNGTAAPDDVAVTYSTADATAWPEVRDTDAMQRFFDGLFNIRNRHLIVHSKDNSCVVAILVESSRPDDLETAIAEDLKKAAGQCSRANPAILAVQLVDPIDPSGLESLLKTSNGLHRIAYQLFKNDRRSHVDSIVYALPQIIRQESASTSRISGDSINLFNPHSRFSCPEVRTAFGIVSDAA